MKLANIQKGTRTVRRVKLFYSGLRPKKLAQIPEFAEENEEAEEPPHMVVGLRPLTGGEEATVLENAQAFAKGRGVEKWDDDHPQCILGKWVHQILLAAVDVDSPEEPFFASESQILESRELGRDGIVFLADAQRQLQSDCSPHVQSMTAHEYIGFIATIAEADDPGPFFDMAPALQWSCMRTMARQLLTLPRLRLLSGSEDEPDTPSSNKNVESEQKKKPKSASETGEGEASA